VEKLKRLFSFLKNQPFIDLEIKIISLFKSAPKFPPGIVDFLVSFAPYLALIGGVLGVLSVLTFFSLGNIIYTFKPSFVTLFYLPIIGSIISGIMLIAAYPDLKEKKLFGWKLVFWAVNVSILISLLSLNLLGALLGAVVSWYILSEVKGKYS
jgi:hypothetical protein